VGGTLGLAAAVLLGVGPAGPPAAAPAPATEPVTRTVTVYGAAGSFGSLGTGLPSGQQLGQRAVPGWGLPPGSQAGPAAVAADGTVFLASQHQPAQNGEPADGPPVIAAYQPTTGEFSTIPVPGGAGPVAGAGGQAGTSPAPEIAHLAPLAGGRAVAFTAAPGPDAAATGDWPVLGILTERDGRWQVAGGEDWQNQWTGGQLRASAPPLSERACPEEPGGAGRSDCRRLGELVSLPGSGHLIVAQAGSPGWYNGQLLALRLAGPDRAGRFTVTVAGTYLYPNVRDPETGEYLDLAFRDLQADPTGRPGQERFAVGLRDTADPDRPLVLQEFGYDAATGQITPVSAPTIPGDRAGPDGPLYGYAAAGYDQHGNLWAARHQSLAGGSLAVYTGGLDCPYDPWQPPESYRTSAGDRTAWGQTCRPDYDLLAGRELSLITNLIRNPAGGEVVALGLTGGLLPIRASGPADDLTFHVGNLVDTGLRLLPAAPGATLTHRPGGYDAAGQLWLPAAQAQPGATGQPVDQWLYEVAVADLFDPPPVPVPDVPGEVVTVQAGHTVTTGTEPQDGGWASTDVVPDAYLRPCTEGTSSVGCSYDGLPGDGFMLSHHSGFGHLAGQVGYRVEVPVAGQYRVAYRVLTFETTAGAEIQLSAGGRVYRTPVDTGGRWLTVPVAEPVALPAGVHTIRIAPPDDRGGWFLSYLALQRA
jgi:hypothetical protein